MKNDSNNAAKQMIARYPDLKPYPKSAAENLRRELRAVFPQITFSVRYKSFSGGDEITVSYEDGPKVEEVEAIANKYAYDSSQCDAMTDYYDYRPTEFTRIFGGAKFVLIRRDMSDRVRADLYCKAVEIAPDLADGRNVRREELFRQRLFYDSKTGAGDVPLPKSNDYGTGSIINERHRLRHVQTGRDIAPGGRTLHAWGLSL